MEPFFLNELPTIERAIRFACRRGSLRHDEADEFDSYVKLKLIDDDYAILRKFDGRSSFAGFISVVVHRLLLDYRIAQWGKWHSSAQARRLGEPAITIEALLIRDRLSLDEALPALQRRWPELTRRGVEEIIAVLPPRPPRPRTVDVDEAVEMIGANGVDETAFQSDRLKLSRRVAEVVRRSMNGLEERDRVIFRLHFDGGLSLAQISRVLQMDQKPLYRRLQRALHTIRQSLEAEGFTAADASEILASRCTDLDFGFSAPTTHEEGL